MLGIPRSLHKLALDISCLSKRAPLITTEDLIEAKKFNAELSMLEGDRIGLDGQETKALGVATEGLERDPYSHMAQLYMLCSRLLLVWATLPAGNLVPSHYAELKMRQLVHEAVQILRNVEETAEEPWTFLGRWPLLILGHAVEQETDMEVVRIALERTWLSLRCGDVKRTLDQLETIWRERRVRCGSSCRGLDSLSDRRRMVEELYI